MSRLQAARDRLEQAVDKLEAAAEESERLSGHAPSELSDALNAVREENASLHETNKAVGNRLDRIIDRLRSVLDG